MKVLHLISSRGYYGAEAMVLNLCLGLESLGDQSTLGIFVNHRPTQMDVARIAQLRGIAVQLFPCAGRMDPSAISAVRRFAAEQEITVLHAHGYKAQVYGYLTGRGLHAARVATCHGYVSRFSPGGMMTLADLRQRVYHAVNLRALRRYDQVAATSALLADALRRAGVDGERLSVISNGVDTSASLAQPAAALASRKNGGLAIGMIGRLVEGKGHADLLHAMRQVVLHHPATHLFIVGEGPLRPALEQLTRKLGLVDNVLFTGVLSTMDQVYAVLDLVVLPSYFEGLPMVLLEALAAGKAVVATPVGAVPEVVLHEQTGLLIAPGDRAALQHSIERLLGDAALRAEFGEQGHALVSRRFSARAMAEQYRKIYTAAIGCQTAAVR